MNFFLNGFKSIAEAFAKDLGIWWFLAPILILWIASQFYYGEYKREKVSFAGAFSSAVSFSWINISTLRILFLNEPDDIWIRFYILIVFLAYALFLIYNAFFHKLEVERLGLLASPNVIYPLSIAVILFGQGHLKITFSTIFDILLVFSVFWLFLFFFKKKFLGVGGDVEAIRVGELPKDLEDEKAKILPR